QVEIVEHSLAKKQQRNDPSEFAVASVQRCASENRSRRRPRARPRTKVELDDENEDEDEDRKRESSLFSCSVVVRRNMNNFYKNGPPSSAEEGKLGRMAQLGWLESEHQGCTSQPSMTSNHPDSRRWLLSAAPYPRRGTIPFSLTVAAPHGMK